MLDQAKEGLLVVYRMIARIIKVLVCVIRFKYNRMLVENVVTMYASTRFQVGNEHEIRFRAFYQSV